MQIIIRLLLTLIMVPIALFLVAFAQDPASPRKMLTADLETAISYLRQLAPAGIPETVRVTTTLGISRKVFRELKAREDGRPDRLPTGLCGQPVTRATGSKAACATVASS